ncbi:MAG: transposase, partial [Actinomycetota bacterium]|nr:transposase [Actinomycetota bacterium]
KAKAALHEMMYAPTKDYCQATMEQFEQDFGAKYPKATQCLIKDMDTLTTHFDFPGEHWVHIRSTNPIESTFVTFETADQSHQGSRFTIGRPCYGFQAHGVSREAMVQD